MHFCHPISPSRLNTPNTAAFLLLAVLETLTGVSGLREEDWGEGRLGD